MSMRMEMTNASRWFEFTFWRVVFLVLTATGTVVAILRYSRGLGATTNLSDQFPWGLWIGFDVLTGVGLAAGGFTITAVVHLFNLKRFTPIVRPTVLTAFLGYLFVILALLFDLGQPQRIWHALVMWNPRSVMFEVAWCVMLYTTVLALEFSPVVFERLNMERPRRIVRAISIPLVILGVILSTLHQSSLGSLYLIVPMKLHPLWYSPLLPVFFFTSAIAAGLAMVIVESHLCQRAFNHHLEMDLLEPLGRAMVVVLSIYGILRLQDLARRGALAGLRRLDYEGSMFLLEMTLGVLLPIVLLVIPRVRAKQPGLVTGAFLVVLGFVMNRLNVSVTGMERANGVAYFPSWMEIALSLALVAAGFAIFGLAVRYLPIFPEGIHPAREAEAPAWLVARPAWGFADGSWLAASTGESTPDAPRPSRSLPPTTNQEASTPPRDKALSIDGLTLCSSLERSRTGNGRWRGCWELQCRCGTCRRMSKGASIRSVQPASIMRR